MNSMREEIQGRTARVQAVIERYLPAVEGPQKTIFAAMNDAVLAGGKRLRPLLMLETYRRFGGDGEEIEPFMAAMEMLHTSSLIHDDLPCMDNDTLRRGRPTTWVKFGYDMAVLAGDALMLYAFETAAKAFALTDRPERAAAALSVFSQKAGVYGMVGGQVVDVELTGKPVPVESLDFIYRLKTGALLEASMMIGAILAGAGGEDVKKTEEIAAAVGLAFQIRDDILDVTGSQEKLGKPLLSDEKNQKTTYVSLKGLASAEEAVAAHSARALRLLGELPGENAFLDALIESLITRES